jgi:CRP-like cAMP-binding protein
MVSALQLSRNSYLQTHPMLSALPADDRRGLVASFDAFRRPAGDRLFTIGDPPDGLYIIERGELCVHIGEPEGRRVLLAELSSGAVIGETGLLRAGARSATVEALTEVAGWWLPRRRFEALHAEGDPGATGLLLHVARTIVERRRQTERRLRALVESADAHAHLPSRATLELVGTLLGT